MKELLNNLAKLIKVKTIVTFLVMAVFAVLALRGDVEAQSVMQVATMVLAFYFGTQVTK